MAHWKLTLSYDGTGFHGWQVQPGLATVQGTLAAALAQVTGEHVLPQGSGRTDAGVHALAQVASFTLQADLPPASLQRALNHALPPSIRVIAAVHVNAEFHARRSARSKVYEYRIFERRRGDDAQESHVCAPFLSRYVWDCHWPLRTEAMRAAAGLLVGEHDFASFAASDPDRTARLSEAAELGSTVRTIFSSAWVDGDGLLIYRVHGNGFLHHMVRNIVGTMVDVGRGSLEVDDLARILAGRDRRLAGPTAPASGLFLVSVDYDEPVTA